MNRRSLIVSGFALVVAPVANAETEPVADEMSADWQDFIQMMATRNPLAGQAALRAYMMDIDLDSWSGIYTPCRGQEDEAKSPTLHFGNWQSDEVCWAVTATNARKWLNLDLPKG